MALVRWEPSRELETFQSDMNRLFDSFFRTGTRPAGQHWAPATDLVEEGDDLVLRLDLPGMTDEDVEVEIESNVLTVSGERSEEQKVEEGGQIRRERSFGRFARSFTLPEGTDAEKINGTFDKGVLEIRIPKPVIEQPKKVKIAVGNERTIEGSSSEE